MSVLVRRTRMAHVRAAVLICACTLVADVASGPALAKRPSKKELMEIKRNEHKEHIHVRRAPHFVPIPISMWPMPRYEHRDIYESPGESHESFHLRRKIAECLKRDKFFNFMELLFTEKPPNYDD